MPRKSRISYNSRIANRICEYLASGMSLKKALAKEPYGPSVMTIYRWLDGYPTFREKYERARLLQADVHADTMMDMAADVLENPQKASAYRVASDILQWQASMRNPKLYGSKVTVESKAAPLNPEQVKAEIKRLEEELNVDTDSTFKSRDADTTAKNLPSPNPESASAELSQYPPSLFDATVGTVQ